MKTIIEIGGFDGEDTEKYLKDDSFVYCFEPDNYHAEKLKLRFFNKKNIKIINKAVGMINGISKFYIGKNKMSSSINELSNYSIENKITEYEMEVDVEVIRLDTFIDENNIDSIDYFHCDAQGSDLDILKSLNEKISLIKRGQVEGSRNENLYNTENRHTYLIEYLEKNNFIVINKEEINKKINWKDLNILFVNKKYQTIL
jgi:FkbM family methyltransferase